MPIRTFVKTPVAELISKPYAAERRKLIDRDKARTARAGGRSETGARRHRSICARWTRIATASR